MWKKRLIQAFWILAGTGTVVLLVAAMQKKSVKACSDVQVEITGATEHVFVDEKDVLDILKSKGSFKGVATNAVKLREIEEALENDPWIQNAELFFDNNQLLQVRITEREPIARIFTVMGSSFYLDSSGMQLPLSEKLSARVPVFTSFPYGKKLSAPDSALLKDVIKLSSYILTDSFWNAQIAQIDISGNEFEMVPVIGNHIIQFGDVSDMEKKFKKLFAFYKNVSTRVGFDKYERINLVYDGQIVATRRGAIVPVADSARAMQQFQHSLETMATIKDTVLPKGVVTNNHVQQPKAVMKRSR
jgi:cell division protein FtsQ